MLFTFENIFAGLVNESMKSKESKPIPYYPIFLNIHGKNCVVVGGGKVALRKVKMLLECGAKVVVISPKMHRDLAQLAKGKAIQLIERDYERGDLKGATIVIAATDEEKINKRIANEGKERGIFVNVVDNSELSDFIIPSFFRRGNLTVAVSTSGVSPTLARKIRMKIEKSFGEEYASLLSLIGEVRSTLKEKVYIVDVEAWQEALDLDLLIQLVRSGQRKKAKVILLSKLEAHKERK